MAHECEPRISINLEGDWSMSGIAQQFQLVLQWAAQLAVAGCSPATAELDLSGITEFDASGCQLLTAFVGNLQRQGMMPLVNGVAGTVSDKFRQLGFDQDTAVKQFFPGESV